MGRGLKASRGEAEFIAAGALGTVSPWGRGALPPLDPTPLQTHIPPGSSPRAMLGSAWLSHRARRRGNIFPRVAGSGRDFPQPVCRVLPEPARPPLRCWNSLAVISSLGSCNGSGMREVTGPQVRAPARSCIRPTFPALSGGSPRDSPFSSSPRPAHPAVLPAAGRGLGAAGRPVGPLPADPGSAQIGNPAGAEAWEPRPSFSRGWEALGFWLQVASAARLLRAGLSWEEPGRREWRSP